MKYTRRLLSAIVLTTMWMSTFGQATSVFTEHLKTYKKAVSLYEKGVYAAAKESFDQFLDQEDIVFDPEFSAMRTKAELYLAQCDVRLGLESGEKRMLDFVKSHQPDPIANQAIFELADYFYAARKYKEAAKYFERINLNTLTEEQKAEAAFKHAYVLFVQKDFRPAQSKFQQVRNIASEFQTDAQYYYGMCSYYLEDDEDAITAWRKIQDSPKYKKTIPFYIAQIYFRQGQYDELIAYAEPLLASDNQNKNELNQLLGQAYYEKGAYEKALPYLEYYEQHSRKMRKEDFYQLAYLQYQLEKFEAAIPNFQQLDKVEEPIGQAAMYYLADCFLKTGNESSARNALQLVSKMKFDPELQEDALFQFAKLSAAQGYDRQAIGALQRFLPESKYYTEAQDIMSEVLVNTKDYKTALEIIENMSQRSPKVKATYQNVCFRLGLQSYQKEDFANALKYFEKSNSEPIDPRVKAMSTYWTGDIQHLQKKYALSKGSLNAYEQLAINYTDLPAASSLGTALYTQGYNSLKLNDFRSAAAQFEKAILYLEKQNSTNANWPEQRDQLVSDALLRSGDCNFKQNKYPQAIRFYDQAIQTRARGHEYALFQKAIINGLNGKVNEKHKLLLELADNYPNSSFTDDALLELGRSYQNAGDFANALYPLEQLVNRFKGKSNLINRAYIQMGLAHYNLNDPQKALQSYKSIFQYNPNPDEAKEALTAIEEIYLSDLSDPNGYVAFVESLPGYSVSDAGKDSIQFQVAERLYENGEYERAIDAYAEYLKRFPKGFYQLVSIYHRAESASIVKKFDIALSDYEQLIGIGESRYYLDALSKAALISYNAAQDFEKSFTYYAKLEPLVPEGKDKFDAQLGAMRSAFRIKNFKAVNQFAMKVQQNAYASTDEKATAAFFLGKLALEEQRFEGAKKYFTESIDYLDNEFAAEAKYALAYIAFVERDLEKADELARKSYSESAAHPYWVAKSLILLSDVLVAKQDIFNAKAALEAVVDNFSQDEELVTEAKKKLADIQKLEAQQNRLIQENKSNNLILDNNNE